MQQLIHCNKTISIANSDNIIFANPTSCLLSYFYHEVLYLLLVIAGYFTYLFNIICSSVILIAFN